MKLRIVALTLLTLVSLVACGGPSVDQADPGKVAQAAAEAWMKSDLDALIDLSCKRMKKQLEASRASREEMAEMMRSMGVDLKDVRFDFTDVVFEIFEQEEFTAKVKMTGPLKVSIPGRSPDIAEQDMTLTLVQEDGDWRLCSELN